MSTSRRTGIFVAGPWVWVALASGALASGALAGCGSGEGHWLADRLLAHHQRGNHHPPSAGGEGAEVDAGPSPSPDLDPEGDAALRREQAAKAVLEAHCSSCHDAADGVLGDITDTGAMIDRGELQPGQPEASRIYYRTLEGSMPPPSVEPRPTAEDVQALYDFIAGLN